ncbi:hypothetical protein LTR37_020503 [Vermiconidia calcicola]|uniref:Uncharacterized protein n=1 Tax=Vermiconidia calcicola TaxID=1690605 RepID=A0ACC3MD42_9PEZI|nr:hypothetical protein LTR37_020503 [Vermiconidia calcicola]
MFGSIDGPEERGFERRQDGDAVCRKRHMKCDESKPTCGPCAKGSRNCTYANVLRLDTLEGAGSTTFASTSEQRAPAHQQHSRYKDATSRARQPAPQCRPVTPPRDDALEITGPRSSFSTSARHGNDGAPLRWFGLLVGDASDIDLDLPSLDMIPGNALAQRHQLQPGCVGVKDLPKPGPSSAAPAEGVALRNPPKPPQIPVLPPLQTSCGDSIANERHFWEAAEPIRLKDHEYDMFKRFVTDISLWIDLFDGLKHFSTLVPQLAIHNTGLMKAVLALGARHLSIRPLHRGESGPDRTAAVQYYHETLQYLQSAMRYASYKNSPELLATVLVLSTFEMIDGAGKEWERHLKGVFWIQRSRDINGESGGLEQAIWWAWLRQDVWAAFTERRRCFSFFKPTKQYQAMDMWDMACRVVYILAQAVNYSSDEEKQMGEADLPGRIERANTILAMLDEWKSSISIHFRPLPIQGATDRAFTPLWVHPPALGTSIQMHCMARILLLIHQPAPEGHRAYLSRDKHITQCIDTIGGIALELTDEASRLMSTQCLFAVGLYCTDETKRARIGELIREHSSHTGWPSNIDLAEELQLEWTTAG